MIRAGLAFLLFAQVVMLAVLIGGDSGNVVVLVPPVIVAAPQAPSPPPPPPRPKAEPAAKPVCPAPVRDVRASRVGIIDDLVGHVHPSPTDARWIAAWNDDYVWVSRDAGATFTRVLDGPGTVADVGFDCFGNPIVLRGAAVGTIVDGGEVWRTIPGITSAARVIDGGPDLAILGIPAQIAVSSDHGLGWRFRDLDRAYEAASPHGRESADGTIDVAVTIADCDYAGIIWATWRASGEYGERRITVDETSTFGLYDGVLVDDGRLSHDGSAWQPIAGWPERGTSLEAPWPAVLGEGGIASRIRGGKAIALPYCVDGRAPAIDAAGRVWMIDGSNQQPAIAGPMHDSCQLAPEPDED
jgi:hypothetical protein